MNLRQEAASLFGEWSGHNRLWLGPSEPARESDTSLQVTTAANGQFLVLTYAWSHEGEPHDGVLMVRLGHEPGPVDMVWVDSFHTMGTFMQFGGRPATDGDVEGFTTWSPGSRPESTTVDWPSLIPNSTGTGVGVSFRRTSTLASLPPPEVDR